METNKHCKFIGTLLVNSDVLATGICRLSQFVQQVIGDPIY